jgi:hypothetical protein
MRSPEAASEGVTPAKVKAYEELWQRREHLESRIRAAFADCRLGDGIGLLEADAWDMCADPNKPREARERDERQDWQSLSRADLSWCNTALCFTDAVGYRFLVPAFMLADLDGDIDEMIIIHLSLTKEDPHGTRSQLNCAQIEAIIEFLELFLDDPDSRFHHPKITEALDAFWRPLLRNRKQEDEAEHRS